MKKFMITLGICAIFGILAAGSFSSDSNNSGGSTTASTTTNKEKEKEEKAKEFYLGDTVQAGKFSIAVLKPEVKPSVGSQYIKQEANGVYWIFPVAVRNDDTESRLVDTTMFQLISESGAKSNPDASAGMLMDTSSLFLERINPGVQVDSYVIFDMPKDHKPETYKLAVRGGVGFKSTTPIEIILQEKK
ncbi:Telomeric repeat-binding factor 2 [compost metagenome]